MGRWSKTLFMVVLAGLIMLAGAYVGAQEKAPGQMAPPAQARKVQSNPPSPNPTPWDLSPSN